MEDNRARLEQAIADWNRGALDAYLTIYDPSVQLHGYSPEPMNLEQVKGFYGMIAAAFPGSIIELLDVITEGDRVVARFAQTGQHDGDFMGVPPSGNPIVLNGITILKFAGGRVIERHSSADMLGLMVQIGAIPPPS